MTRFALITTQRSGSNFLRSVLNSHPEIFVYDEVLLESAWEHDWSIYQFMLQSLKEDPFNITYSRMLYVQRAYIDNILSEKDGRQIVGADIKYDQLMQFPSFLELMRQAGVKVIHLVRTNVLKTLVSAERNRIMRQQGMIKPKTTLAEKLPPVKLPLECGPQLINSLKQRQAQIQQFSAQLPLHFPYLEVHYESFFENDEMESKTIADSALQNVYEFLGVKQRSAPTKSYTVKQNPARLSDSIENFEQVKEFLSLNGYGHFIDA
ncbi:MAG: sulfotransferase domain-containing protein [Bdellovibrionales bacterium]|nr:sulfotransferase domain-containing protein [Bdellovibrionales bacterium]